MNLQCRVAILSRSEWEPIVRYVKSGLSLRIIGEEYFILLFYLLNNTTKQYRIKCIEKVSLQFLDEGKAAITFEDPPHELRIKCEPIQMKGFIKLLRQCVTGHAEEVQLQTTNYLCRVNDTPKKNAPTELLIQNRREYTSKSLPRKLEALYLPNLQVRSFRRDILQLPHLAILDLSDNKIEKLPSELGRMPNLRELHLGNNQIGKNEMVDWKWLTEDQISKSLILLDLSGNKLRSLPNTIWKLRNLITLKLDNNNLEKIPITIGRLNTLRHLSLSQNELCTLPGSLLQCRLASLDVSFTKVHIKGPKWMQMIRQPENRSLLNIAANVVIKQKINYGPDLLPRTLVSFLDSVNICVCGTPVSNDVIHKKIQVNLQSYYPTIIVDNSICANFECIFCSLHCFFRMVLFQRQ